MKEFQAVFQLSKTEIFEVSYYTLRKHAPRFCDKRGGVLPQQTRLFPLRAMSKNGVEKSPGGAAIL